MSDRFTIPDTVKAAHGVGKEWLYASTADNEPPKPLANDIPFDSDDLPDGVTGDYKGVSIDLPHGWVNRRECAEVPDHGWLTADWRGWSRYEDHAASTHNKDVKIAFLEAELRRLKVAA